jgi:proteic killer suppression protein
VIRSFRDDATEQVFYGEDTRVARKLPKPLWPLIRRKLDALHAARSLDDLRQPPGNRLEGLRGQRRGRCGIRVNVQFRITFQFEDGEAWEVSCEDYH